MPTAAPTARAATVPTAGPTAAATGYVTQLTGEPNTANPTAATTFVELLSPSEEETESGGDLLGSTNIPETNADDSSLENDFSAQGQDALATGSTQKEGHEHRYILVSILAGTVATVACCAIFVVCLLRRKKAKEMKEAATLGGPPLKRPSHVPGSSSTQATNSDNGESSDDGLFLEDEGTVIELDDVV